MVKINSTSRFFNIKSKIILTQTDTTVGFLSQDETKLQNIKSRDNSKPFIKVYKNFKELKKFDVRVPNSKKLIIRRSKKRTFIVKNVAFRVVEHNLNSSFLRTLTWSNSTSANQSNKKFSRVFCEQKADIIIEDKHRLYEDISSSLYKINTKKIKRLR